MSTVDLIPLTFEIRKATLMISSKERALVYEKCQHLFDLSLRIHQSIQQFAAVADNIISMQIAHELLQEHTNLMKAVNALKTTLSFESELFESYPAPVLLDMNGLLRYKAEIPMDYRSKDTSFVMQMWLAIDGVQYVPVSRPEVLQQFASLETFNEENPNQKPKKHSMIRFHELCGVDLELDDNTIRYALTEDQLCVNALVNNAFLLFLFNPFRFRPNEWKYNATLTIVGHRLHLPAVRERAYLSKACASLRIYFCYGGWPLRSTEFNNNAEEADHRKGTTDAPLGIPYLPNCEIEFELFAKNTSTGDTYSVISQKILLNSANRASDVIPNADRKDKMYCECPRHEWQRKIQSDSMISYAACNGAHNAIQYIECAVGMETLIHRLGIANLVEEVAPIPVSRNNE